MFYVPDHTARFQPPRCFCSTTGNIPCVNDSYEFVYLSRPPLDIDGNCSFSVKAHSTMLTDKSIIGFCTNDTLSRPPYMDIKAWDNVFAVNLFGDRDIEASTVTLSYNERKQTMCCFFDHEPPIFLRFPCAASAIYWNADQQ